MMRAILPLAVLLTVCCLSGGCQKKETDPRVKERPRVEESMRPFDPTFAQDAKRQHLAVYFEVAQGKLKLAGRPAEIRPGRMPFRSADAGSVLVVYKDARGQELGRYATEDPAMVRSCDDSAGAPAGATPIAWGTVEVLLPYDLNIATVEIGPVAGPPTSFDVSAQVKRAIPPGRPDTTTRPITQ